MLSMFNLEGFILESVKADNQMFVRYFFIKEQSSFLHFITYYVCVMAVTAEYWSWFGYVYYIYHTFTIVLQCIN